jgi:hypothetical protein
MQVAKYPGRMLMISGSILVVLAIFFYFLAPKRGRA